MRERYTDMKKKGRGKGAISPSISDWGGKGRIGREAVTRVGVKEKGFVSREAMNPPFQKG